MFNYIYILIKQYIKLPYTYIAFFLPYVFMLVLGKQIPIGVILSASISISILSIVFFLLISNIQELRLTGMIKSISLTKISKKVLIISNIIVGVFFIVISISSIMLLCWTLDIFNYFAKDMTAFGDSEPFKILNYTIIWSSIDWWTFFYGVVISIILTFAMAFFIISITKTIKSVYMFAIIYIFILTVLGGIIVPIALLVFSDTYVQYIYYFIPHYYSNQLILGSLVTSNEYLKENFEIIYNLFGDDGVIQIEDLDWDAILIDTNYIIQWYANNPDPTLAQFESEISNPDIYNSDLFILLSSPIPIGPINTDSILVMLFKQNPNEPLILAQTFNLLAQNSDWITQFFSSIEVWNFSDWRSVLVVFVPIIIIFGLFGGTLIFFNWTIY